MASFTLKANKNTGHGVNTARDARAEKDGGLGGYRQTGYAFYGFDLSALEGQKLNRLANFRVYGNYCITPNAYSYCSLEVYPCRSTWKDQEWTWQNIPIDSGENAAGNSPGFRATDGYAPPGWITFQDFNEEKVQSLLRYGLAIGATPGDAEGIYQITFFTQATEGDSVNPSYAPTLTADFAAVPLALSSLYPASGASYLAGETVPLSWSATAAEAEGGAVFGTAKAANYKVRWRLKNAAGYNEQTVTSPSYRLGTSGYAAGETVEWQVVATATNGAVTEGKWQTISLKAASITISDLYPSGSSDIYAGIGFTASWKAVFTVPSGTIGSSYQASAVVRVRKRGTTDASEYRVSGSRQSIALPAVGEGAWEWQVEVTDNHGTAKASSWTGFTAKALAISATDLYPTADNRAPSKISNRFSWRVVISDDPEYANIKQQSAIFRWRQTGQSQTHEVTLGLDNQYTVPAGTFPAKSSIDWQVTIVANTGIETTTDWVTVPTSDALSRPVCVSPVGVRVTDDQGITFAWQNVIATNTPQQAWELSTSEDAGARWVVQGSGDNAATAFTLPAGVLTQPSVQWRVRTKNTDGDWGQYSQTATFILLRAAETPSISYTDSRPLTILEWQSNEQEAYRVRIDGFDTGWVISTEGRYFHPYILADGPHAVRVQIMNATGSASAETAITIQTANVPGEAPKLSLTERDGYVMLSWPAVDGTAYVVRDGIAIARPEGQSYIDYKTVGKHEYILRVVKDRYYTDSPLAVGITHVRYALLTPLDRMDFVELALRRGNAPTHGKSVQGQTAYRHYYGRAKPVKYTAGFVDVAHDIGFTLRNDSDIAKIEIWVTGDVIYKDCFGRLAVGGLDGVDEDLYRYGDVDFTLTESDYKEGVLYAED